LDPCPVAVLVNRAYYPPTSDDRKKAWRVTEGILLMIRDEARQHGVPFWLVVDSNGRQVDPGHAAGS
jgi:hypothetical protein